jgi:protein-arginine kinase activator protein McsA
MKQVLEFTSHNIEVPKQILDLERQLEDVRELKMFGKTKYEEAAKLRDDENVLKRLSHCSRTMGRR